MPLLSEIDETAIGARLPASNVVANKVPLVHVEPSPNLFDVIEQPPHELSTYATSGKSPNTKRAEELLGLPPSVYFYAGRAHPRGNARLHLRPDARTLTRVR